MVFRSIAFNIAFYANLFTWFVCSLPAMLGPRRWIIPLMHGWARSSLWLLRMIAGIRLEIRGDAHRRTEPLLVAAKHQSLFETFALLPLFADPAFILKRELNWIPLFGWWAVKLRMIPVDRAKGSLALKAMSEVARREADAGRQIAIFPEGTRRSPGAEPRYKVGVGYLYEICGVPCLPVALNSGLYWPRRSWQRHRGTIVVEILEPIQPGLPRDRFMELLEARIEAASDRLLEEAAAAPDAPPLPETARRRLAERAEADPDAVTA